MQCLKLCTYVLCFLPLQRAYPYVCTYIHIQVLKFKIWGVLKNGNTAFDISNFSCVIHQVILQMFFKDVYQVCIIKMFSLQTVLFRISNSSIAGLISITFSTYCSSYLSACSNFFSNWRLSWQTIRIVFYSTRYLQ